MTLTQNNSKKIWFCQVRLQAFFYEFSNVHSTTQKFRKMDFRKKYFPLITITGKSFLA